MPLRAWLLIIFIITASFSLCGRTALSRPNDIVIDSRGVRHGTGFSLEDQRALLADDALFANPQVTLATLPAAYDSRDHGWVGVIKNQGTCGSCWAQAFTENLEDAMIKAGEPVQVFSADELIDCDTQAMGCRGGSVAAVDYLVQRGVSFATDYPARRGSCPRVLPNRAARARAWFLIGASDRAPTVDEIKRAIFARASVFATVAAGGSDWDGRVEMTACGNSRINHMVELVGWTADNKWVIRNSWGANWGSNGYAYAPFGCNLIGATIASVGYVVY